jgi:phospholipid/cholesterol/gamma-HCH transport system permease protein
MLILLKGPIFGFIIGTICSYEAYSVSLNSESVVAAITKGVVYSIFVCILADVLMNILFFSLGIT